MNTKLLQPFDYQDFLKTANRQMIGFDQQWSKFFSQNPLNPSNYPPHNIEKVGDDQYRLTVAVAGFSKDELEVTVENGILQLKGNKEAQEDISNFMYRGIALRTFALKIGLGEYVKVSEAKMADGLLTLDLKYEMPEAMKPKTIAIK